MMIAQTKPLKFLLTILTGKERKWLDESDHSDALRFRRLKFLLNRIPGDKKVEEMMSWLLVNVMSHKTAYQGE